MDDKLDLKLTAENAHQLIADKQVLASFPNRGTPHTVAINPVCRWSPRPPARWCCTSRSRSASSTSGPLTSEAQEAVEHLLTMGVKRIAVVHTHDSFGQDGLQGAVRGLTRSAGSHCAAASG